MATFNLSSEPMFHTPGVVRWLGNVAKTDRPTARMIAKEAWPSLPEEAIKKLLSGDFTVDQEKELVVVEI